MIEATAPAIRDERPFLVAWRRLLRNRVTLAGFAIVLVMVICAIQGEAVSTPGGPQTIWVKVTAGQTTGYVSAVYVDIGQTLADPTKIGDCPAA